MTKNKVYKTLAVFFILVIFQTFVSCAKRDALERIKRSGEITLLTRNNAHCYYNYKGRFEGFEYDLAKAFSDYLGVELKVITPSWEGVIDALQSGEGDFIAASMTITPSREKTVDFSREYLIIQQKVIIHKNNHEIKKIEDLKGKTIHVRRGTSYEERLKELQNEGLGFHIKLYDDVPTEELIRMVAEEGLCN